MDKYPWNVSLSIKNMTTDIVCQLEQKLLNRRIWIEPVLVTCDDQLVTLLIADWMC